jgi:hypothetical protein
LAQFKIYVAEMSAEASNCGGHEYKCIELQKLETVEEPLLQQAFVGSLLGDWLAAVNAQ